MNQLKSVRRKCYEILCKIRGGGGGESVYFYF